MKKQGERKGRGKKRAAEAEASEENGADTPRSASVPKSRCKVFVFEVLIYKVFR